MLYVRIQGIFQGILFLLTKKSTKNLLYKYLIYLHNENEYKIFIKAFRLNLIEFCSFSLYFIRKFLFVLVNS